MAPSRSAIFNTRFELLRVLLSRTWFKNVFKDKRADDINTWCYSVRNSSCLTFYHVKNFRPINFVDKIYFGCYLTNFMFTKEIKTST